MSGNKRKRSTPKLVSFGYLNHWQTGTCEGCQRWPKSLRFTEMHWKDKRDVWVTQMHLCGACAAILLAVVEDGADPVALFGTRYPFVT